MRANDAATIPLDYTGETRNNKVEVIVSAVVRVALKVRCKHRLYAP